jgi:hypothetical protein
MSMGNEFVKIIHGGYAIAGQVVLRKFGSLQPEIGQW